MATDAVTRKVLAMLSVLDNVALLEEIARDLGLPDVDDIAGDEKQLYRRICNHINSDALDGSEDGGLGQIMAIRDKLRISLKIAAPDPDDENLAHVIGRSLGYGFALAADAKGDTDGDISEEEKEKVKKKKKKESSSEEEDEDSDDEEEDEGKDSLRDLLKSQKNKNKADRRGANLHNNWSGFGGPFGGFGGPNPGLYGNLGGVGGVNTLGGGGHVDAGFVGKFRELKLDGVIGKPGEKKKLNYRSLVSQIRNAITRGFSDSDIVSAVIRCIPCNSTL